LREKRSRIFGTPPRVGSLPNNITVNDTFTFDLNALGERVQVGRRHPAGVFKSDVKRLQLGHEPAFLPTLCIATAVGTDEARDPYEEYIANIRGTKPIQAIFKLIHLIMIRIH